MSSSILRKVAEHIDIVQNILRYIRENLEIGVMSHWDIITLYYILHIKQTDRDAKEFNPLSYKSNQLHRLKI